MPFRSELSSLLTPTVVPWRVWTPSEEHRADSYFFSPDRVELPRELVTHTEAHAIPPDPVTFPTGTPVKQSES